MAEEKVESSPEATEAKETKKEEATEEKVEVPDKFKDIVKMVEEMSALDLSELVKVLEKKFGVTAAAPVVQAVGGGGGESDEAEEQSTFNVELVEAGSSKISVIKVVREITEKGLKEAKDMVDAAPKVIKEGVSKEEAEELKKKIEEAGGKVELK